MHRKLFGGAVTLSLVALIVPSSVSSAETIRSYAATYDYATGDKSAHMGETLTLRRGAPASFMSLSDAQGAVTTSATKFAQDGEIEGASSDPSVTCYNMAAAALFAHAQTPDKPASVFVRVGDGLVAIPVQVREATGGTDGSREYIGTGLQTIAIHDGDAMIPAAMVVEAKMRMLGDTLTDVIFIEETTLGNAKNVVNRQACSLSSSAGAQMTTPINPAGWN